MIKLSIIIPTLNEEKYLPRLLNSIEIQNFLDFEIIVSDGDSKDNTKKIATLHNCQLVVSNKRSPACQRNVGAKQAQGEILLFLDADTCLPKSFLQRSYHEFCRKNLEVAGFYLKFGRSRFVFRLFTATYNSVCFLMQRIFPTSVGVGIMVSKAAHERIGGFDEGIFIGEDYDYTKRISKFGKYRMIASSYINYSVRRLEKEGVLKVLWKWAKGSLYFLIKGPIRKPIVKYDFGGFND